MIAKLLNMRSPSIPIIGACVVQAALGKRVPVYVYKAPPTISPTTDKSPTSSPSYQPSSRPSLQPSSKPSLRPSLEPSSQPTGNTITISSLSTSPKYTSNSESAVANPSSFGFWLTIGIVGSCSLLVFGPSMMRNRLPDETAPVQAEGNGAPVASSTSIKSGGRGNAATETLTLGQAFTELSDLAEKTIFPVDVDDRTKKTFTKKTESS